MIVSLHRTGEILFYVAVVVEHLDLTPNLVEFESRKFMMEFVVFVSWSMEC